MTKKPMMTPGNESGSVSSEMSTPRPMKRRLARYTPTAPPSASVVAVTASDSASVFSMLCRYRASVRTTKYVVQPFSAGRETSRATGSSQKAAKKTSAGSAHAGSSQRGVPKATGRVITRADRRSAHFLQVAVGERLLRVGRNLACTSFGIALARTGRRKALAQIAWPSSESTKSSAFFASAGCGALATRLIT